MSFFQPKGGHLAPLFIMSGKKVLRLFDKCYKKLHICSMQDTIQSKQPLQKTFFWTAHRPGQGPHGIVGNDFLQAQTNYIPDGWHSMHRTTPRYPAWVPCIVLTQWATDSQAQPSIMSLTQFPELYSIEQEYYFYPEMVEAQLMVVEGYNLVRVNDSVAQVSQDLRRIIRPYWLGLWNELMARVWVHDTVVPLPLAEAIEAADHVVGEHPTYGPIKADATGWQYLNADRAPRPLPGVSAPAIKYHLNRIDIGLIRSAINKEVQYV